MATGLRDRTARALARPAAHDRRARERGQRARHRPGEPRAAGGARRPAGPPAPLLRAVPRREAGRARRRVPGEGRAAGPRPGRARARSSAPITPPTTWRGPGARDRADGRLGRARRRGARAGGRDRHGPPGGGRGSRRRSTRSPRSCAGASRPRSSSAPARTTPRRGRRWSSSPSGWSRPVFQETFGARAGFPQDHRLYLGTLPGRPGRACANGSPPTTRSSSSAAPRSASPATRPGRLTEPGTRIAIVTDDPEELHRSPAELARAGAARCRVPRARRSAAGARRPTRPSRSSSRSRRLPPARRRAADRRPRALGARRAPAARRDRARGGARRPARARVPAARPRAARLPQRRAGRARLRASRGRPGCGWRCPNRPIVAVVGDGSAIYQIQAVWSAAHYNVGALFVVLSNGGYAVMDVLAERQGGSGPWPGFGEVELAAVARGFGCPARRIETYEELVDDARRGGPDPRGPHGATTAGRGHRADAGVQLLTRVAALRCRICRTVSCIGARAVGGSAPRHPACPRREMPVQHPDMGIHSQMKEEEG